MNSYNYIVNPLTNRKISITSKTARIIINKYINQLGGGSNLCGYDESTKRCNRKSVGNKDYLYEMGEKGYCRKNKNHNIENNIEDSDDVEDYNIEESDEDRSVDDDDDRELGYSSTFLNRQVPPIIDNSNMENDIELEFNRLQEHYTHTVNHLLNVYKTLSDPDEIKDQIDYIYQEIEVANDDMDTYIKTHYPLYSNNRVVINKKDIERQL